MILKQYYLGCLAHASYLVGDESTGEGGTARSREPRRRHRSVGVGTAGDGGRVSAPSRADRILDRVSAPSRADRILDRVRAIPEGFVSTYGDIDPRAPRLVGQVLAGHPGAADDTLPWHRVVRADGTLTQGAAQRERLRREGVPMRGERVDLRQARLPREGG